MLDFHDYLSQAESEAAWEKRLAERDAELADLARRLAKSEKDRDHWCEEMLAETVRADGLEKRAAETEASLKWAEGRIIDLTNQRDVIEEQRAEAEAACWAMRAALEKLAKLGNEPYEGNSIGNRIAQQALSADAGKAAIEVIRAAVEYERMRLVFNAKATAFDVSNDELRQMTAALDSFSAAIAAYNRERSKE